MKKTVKIFLLCLLSTCLVKSLQINGDFNLLAGSTFDYEVKDSYWYRVDGANSGEGTGFNFRGEAYTIDTSVNTEVITPTNTSVYYTITVGSRTDEAYSYSWDIIGWVLLMEYPFLEAQLTPEPWNQTEVEMGPHLLELFFIDPLTFGNKLVEFTNETYISTIFDDPRIEIDQVEAYFDNSSTIAVFDWVMNVRYFNLTLGTDISGEYYLKLAYDKTQGNLMGFKMDMNYSGNITGTDYALIWREYIEKGGYNLPTFYFKSEPQGFISVRWIYALPPIIMLVIVHKFNKRKAK